MKCEEGLDNYNYDGCYCLRKWKEKKNEQEEEGRR
jgi:hypothetical protein